VVHRSDGAALEAWWGGRPSYRRRSLRPQTPSSALSPVTRCPCASAMPWRRRLWRRTIASSGCNQFRSLLPLGPFPVKFSPVVKAQIWCPNPQFPNRAHPHLTGRKPHRATPHSCFRKSASSTRRRALRQRCRCRLCRPPGASQPLPRRCRGAAAPIRPPADRPPPAVSRPPATARCPAPQPRCGRRPSRSDCPSLRGAGEQPSRSCLLPNADGGRGRRRGGGA
jgi:hypothetical protein